jgi:hypothetical protein
MYRRSAPPRLEQIRGLGESPSRAGGPPPRLLSLGGTDRSAHEATTRTTNRRDRRHFAIRSYRRPSFTVATRKYKTTPARAFPSPRANTKLHPPELPRRHTKIQNTTLESRDAGGG